jgi:tRNA-specific 2-thiouridylase
MGKPPSVVVALSGGVDSSLAAALLKEQGWQVEGVHFLLPSSPAKREERQRSVLRVVESLGIRVSFLDLEAEFARLVLDPFVEAYFKGFTPNPCVICNHLIKFDHLLRYADDRGIDCIATGHYANVRKSEGNPSELWRGRDQTKEQSYFLHRLNQAHLRKTVFPLGTLTKWESRALARERDLPSSEEPESQEICFVPGNDYRAFVESRSGPCPRRKGDILNSQGDKVGEHQGVYRYTIGQRHGLGIASPRPYYVKAIDPFRNNIVVGRKEELFSKDVEAEAFHWIEEKTPTDGEELLAQIRYRHGAAMGKLELLSQERVKFRFHDPQWAVTPGQALVLYAGDRVLGGGWIKKALGEET